MKITNILLTAAVALAASSCSLFQGIAQKHPKSMTVTTAVTQPAKGQQPGKTADKNAQAGTSTENVKPTQSQLSDGQWTVASVGDITIDLEENVPYVNFDRDGRFYASDGCNIINGDYVLRNDAHLRFSHVLSTMKYCPEVEFSALIASLFNDNSDLIVDCRRIGQETYLYLKNNSNKVMMTLRRHNMEFLNGNWQVTAIDGKSINDEEANIFIDIAELKVHGNTGCNYFNGDIYINPTRSNAIDFSNMGVTRMACPKEAQERTMLVALELARSAIAGKHDDTVLLLDGKGNEVLRFKRIPVTDTQTE